MWRTFFELLWLITLTLVAITLTAGVSFILSYGVMSIFDKHDTEWVIVGVYPFFVVLMAFLLAVVDTYWP